MDFRKRGHHLLEAIVLNCDSNLPPLAAHLINGLDLIARFVLVAFQEMLHIVFEALKWTNALLH